MPLDGLYLNSIEKELNNLMINCKIEKINQTEKDEVCLTFKKNRKNHRLLISASSNYPRVHFTNNIKENPLKAPMFCMVLRKYLANSRVLSIEQLGLDRVLKINFESTDELGFNSIYTLIIEIMGRHSNITLVRDRDNLIMDSIKHITSEINSYRSLYPSIEYVYPPKSDKINLLTYNFENFEEIFQNLEFTKDFFSKNFQGISKKVSLSLYTEFLKEYTDFSLLNLQVFLKNLKSKLENGNFNFNIYYGNKGILDFHCFKLNDDNIVSETSFASPSDVLDTFYYEKDKYDRLNSKSADLQKLVTNNIDRCTKKLSILEETLKECEEKDELRLKGELLTSNIYMLSKGMNSIDVQNYYSENLENVRIKLDPNKTPSENIQKYFKKYNKLKKSEEMALINIEHTDEELTYLNSVLNNIHRVETSSEIEEIRKELIETGYIKFSKKKVKDKNKSKPYHFVSSDGTNIYVGKNNLQNDYLTLKLAGKKDIWLHTKVIPGSHVIIQNDHGISDKTLEEAANLAAYYSKGRESSKVEIDYTEVKNVKKPSGAKPGMVIYYTNKTIIIEPKKPELELIEK
ncbi:fibronectin/fibrinogen-binding protein [Clostridiaceae bacterium 14S0207]|nr:fibronectin/fibrinogen-binding protein [Clostridiaceae bacterium 14S0207]